MDEARAQIVVQAIYTSPQNPTSDDFAEIMGLQNAKSDAFSNLDEVLKLVGCCHLLRKLRMRVPNEMQQDIVYSKLCAAHLPAMVNRFLEGPRSPPNAPSYVDEDLKVNNVYLEMIAAISHSPYFSKFLRSQQPVCEGGKQLLRVLASRLIEVAPGWDRRMQNPPVDYDPGYYESAAGTAVQMISTLLAAFVKEHEGSPILVSEEDKKSLLVWLNKWERRYRTEFLGRVCNRTKIQLERHSAIMKDAQQIRRMLKNWNVCGKPDCNVTSNLKVCGRCQTVRYCSPEHQKAHWTDPREPHKSLCFKAEY